MFFGPLHDKGVEVAVFGGVAKVFCGQLGFKVVSADAMFAFAEHVPWPSAVDGFSVYGEPASDLFEECGGFSVECAVGFDGNVQ